MVFHSMDKITSLFIQFGPPLATYGLRWRWSGIYNVPDTASVLHLSLLPFIPYVIWQGLYWLKGRQSFLHRLNLIISVYYIARDRSDRMTSARYALKKKNDWRFRLCSWPFGENGRLFLPSFPPLLVYSTYSAPYWSPTLRLTPTWHHSSHPPSPSPQYAHYGFMAMQFVYMIVTLLPMWLVYHSRHAHATLIVIIGLVSVWNGANYYFEAFKKQLSRPSSREESLDEGEEGEQ